MADLVKGFVPTADVLTRPGMLFVALGIIGATVMPHNLYLHSSIVGSRDFGQTEASRREAMRFATWDSTLALCLAFFVNAGLLVLSAAVLLIVPLAFGLREKTSAGAAPVKREQTIVQALAEAFKYPSFQLLMAGYFVCGFQVVFIGVHMPSYLKDKGLGPEVAGYALALIGLFNVFGTYGGHDGQTAHGV